MISIKGLAAGCSAQICMCPGGGYVTTGQYCPVYHSDEPAPTYTTFYYNFAYDKDTGAYGAERNIYEYVSENRAIAKCGTPNCKIIFSKKAMYTRLVVAASSNGVVITQTEGGDQEDLRNKALKKCAKKKGVNCEIIWSSPQGQSNGW